MAALVERRFSHSALWSRRIGYFALVLLVVGALAHRYGFIETPPALGVLAVVFALALLALALAAVGFARLWRRGDKAGRNALAGTVMALLALVPFGAAGVAYFIYPEVNDVSTDPTDPPRLALAEAERRPPMSPIKPPTPAQIEKQKQAYPPDVLHHAPFLHCIMRRRFSIAVARLYIKSPAGQRAADIRVQSGLAAVLRAFVSSCLCA